MTAVERRKVGELLERHARLLESLAMANGALERFLSGFCRELTPDEEAHRQHALETARKNLTDNLPRDRTQLARLRTELGLL